MSALFRLLEQRFHPPKDNVPSNTFITRTVLITGATTGLGLEAAKKVVANGAKKLIITARDAKRGENALSILQIVTKAVKSSTQVVVLSLGISSLEGVKSFVKELETSHGGLATAILNVSTLQTKWNTSAEGCEETIQVNTISTILLVHLTLISSGASLRVKASNFSSPGEKDVPKAVSEEEAFARQSQYSKSKLLLEYGIRHIANLPKLRRDAGELKGDRQFYMSWHVILAWILFAFITRTTEAGARIFVSAVNRGTDSQGQLWKDDRYHTGSELGEMIGTPHGDKLSERIWKSFG